MTTNRIEAYGRILHLLEVMNTCSLSMVRAAAQLDHLTPVLRLVMDPPAHWTLLTPLGRVLLLIRFERGMTA